jgi:hypothetical protein
VKAWRPIQKAILAEHCHAGGVQTRFILDQPTTDLHGHIPAQGVRLPNLVNLGAFSMARTSTTMPISAALKPARAASAAISRGFTCLDRQPRSNIPQQQILGQFLRRLSVRLLARDRLAQCLAERGCGRIRQNRGSRSARHSLCNSLRPPPPGKPPPLCT